MNPHPFTIYPAIDLRQGKVVRLAQGDPAQQTLYSADPASTAARWLSQGATWLHVVNLDGAFGEEDSANQAALTAILQEAEKYSAAVQFGGGMRTLAAAEKAFDLGVRRIVLGTALIEQPDLGTHLLHTWGPERVAAGMDARDGVVKVRGWQVGSSFQAGDLARDLYRSGWRWLIYTDIARDGMGKGANLAATEAVAHASGLQTIVSGGIHTLEEIRTAAEAGLAGVILGRSLYSGSLDIAQCLVMQSPPVLKADPKE